MDRKEKKELGPELLLGIRSWKMFAWGANLCCRHKQRLHDWKSITTVVCCMAWVDLVFFTKRWRDAAAGTAAAKTAWFCAFFIYCFQYFPWPESLVWFAKDGKTSIESRKDRGLYDIVGSDDGAIVYFESERQNSAGRHTHTSVLRTQKACMAFLKSYKGLKGYYPTDARQQHTAVAVTAAAWVGSPSSALVPPRGLRVWGGPCPIPST